MINLKEKLLVSRDKEMDSELFLTNVKNFLEENQISRNKIEGKIKNPTDTINEFDFEQLESDCIFHLDTIKQVCIDYRLRFLSSSMYKDSLPAEAISKISALEKNHNTSIDGFMIMAPSKAFELENYDDPLLFAPMGNNYFYLIHKWGNELNSYRKLLVKPFKNIDTFLISCLFLSFILCFLVPSSKLSQANEMAPIIIFLFMFKSVVAVLLFVFFMMGKNFNTAIWDRKYYNN
jgi:hypothetical protein